MQISYLVTQLDTQNTTRPKTTLPAHDPPSMSNIHLTVLEKICTKKKKAGRRMPDRNVTTKSHPEIYFRRDKKVDHNQTRFLYNCRLTKGYIAFGIV